MGVYIKGMEIPTSCAECPFLDYEEGFCFASAVKNESGWREPVLCPGEIKKGRHDGCPLVPVPAHGTLIDGYVLFDFILNIYKNAQGEARKAYRNVLDVIVAVGDVIPAEEDN